MSDYPGEPTKWQLGGGNACAVNNIRHEVGEFVIAMEQKLRKNDHKTGWKDQPIEAHLQLLNIEMMELKVALEFLTFDDACKELVDIANFAMIIRNKLMTQGKDAFRKKPERLANPPVTEYNPAWTHGEL